MARIPLKPAPCGCPRYQEDRQTVCSHTDETCVTKKPKKKGKK